MNILNIITAVIDFYRFNRRIRCAACKKFKFGRQDERD